jgi:hypothetical protein
MVGVIGMLRASAFSFMDFKMGALHFLAQVAALFSQKP